ncbi:MAG: molecular chaperone TorD family protein [Burkholderiales bacterium]
MSHDGPDAVADPRGEAEAAILAAMAADLSMLAALHDREVTPDLITQLKLRAFPDSLLLPPSASLMRSGAVVFQDALRRLREPYVPAQLDELAADYAAIYLTHAYQASPCESVWTDPEGLALQASTFRLRERYRSHGLTVENWRQRSEDHLVVQLHFISLLLERLGERALREVTAFMDEHLLRWLPQFAARVVGRCATQFYAGAALLTAGYCDQMRDVLAEMLGEPRPDPASVSLPHPRDAHAEATPPAYVPGAAPSW